LASTGEARVASFEMARTWFRLAEEQEDESANIDNIEVSIPPTPGAQSQPAAQQQQQVQPKDEDKNKTRKTRRNALLVWPTLAGLRLAGFD